MEEYHESNQNGNGASPAGPQRWLIVAVVVLIGIAGVAFAYGMHQQALVRQLSADSSTANASVTQLQSQVNALTAKLNNMNGGQTATQNAAPPAAVESSADADASGAVPVQATDTSATPAPAPAAAPKPAHTKKPAAKHRAPVDSKYQQLQAQLTDQQKQLKATQDEVEKNRADLEGSINSTRADLSSTRDDLNGSIAKTHEELVLLEKRGERSYFEFDLSKSKQFQRIGPITLSLRKADTKHKNYDLAMVVDDNELQKKKVNLYEPVWIHTESESQPVQIVVNKIDKDTVHGYISAPKYKPSELAASSASVTPVSAKSPAPGANPPNPNPNPEQPQEPQQPQQPEMF
jgi:cell division protein FtsB